MSMSAARPNTASATSTANATVPAQALFWDRNARRYAGAAIADVAGYETTLVRVRGLLAREHSVLELGCGTGTTALRLAACTASYLALDVSPAMIAIAREKLAAQPVPRLRFGVADAEAASSDGASFDAVLAFNMLHLVSNLDHALTALLPSLKPGGLFISKTPCLAEMNPLIPRLLVPLMRALGKAPPVLSFDATALRSALERQGLVVEAVERHGSKGRDSRVFIVARKPH